MLKFIKNLFVLGFYLISGCFVLLLLGVVIFFLVFRFGASPRATEVDGIPIEDWLDNTKALEGVEQQKAMEQILEAMGTAMKHPRWRSSVGILPPSQVKENNQQLADLESFRFHSDAFATLIRKSAKSELVENRLTSIDLAFSMYAIWYPKQRKPFLNLIFAASDSGDLEVAERARLKLILILERDQRVWNELGIEEISEIIEDATGDGIEIPETVLKRHAEIAGQ